MSSPCEAAEAGAFSLATPKRMLLGVLALLLISAVVVGVVLKLQSPPPPARKTRARKKAEPKAADTAEPGNMERAEAGGTAPFALPKRGRKKL